MTSVLRLVENPGSDVLDRVFFALSDPCRRAILERLDAGPLLVSELAAPFAMSLQAVSRHIQVLVQAGLIRQERTGRVARCSLDAGPVFAAAVWINRYSKYWQQQFDLLAMAIEDIEERRSGGGQRDGKRKAGSGTAKRPPPRKAPADKTTAHKARVRKTQAHRTKV
jgi:DNA-binding transcriptional ArsR family regulator